MNKVVCVLVALLAGISGPVIAAGGAGVVVHVYGPGGPGPAMREAATEYGEMHRIKVIVTTGPTPLWADEARQDADIIFSGAENMMSDLSKALPGLFDLDDAEPMFRKRPAIPS